MASLGSHIIKSEKNTGDLSSRRRLPPAERERQIVDGAIRYFAEVGFEGQTRELARRLGITPAAAVSVFSDKGRLDRPGLRRSLSQPLEG